MPVGGRPGPARRYKPWLGPVPIAAAAPAARRPLAALVVAAALLPGRGSVVTAGPHRPNPPPRARRAHVAQRDERAFAGRVVTCQPRRPGVVVLAPRPKTAAVG